MAMRTAQLDYRVTGAERSRGQVISLSQALEQQKRKVQEAAPAVRKASQDIGVLGAVSASAAAKNTALANSLGPVGAGLSYVARAAPAASLGLLGYAQSAERASILTRGLNAAVYGGAATFLASSVAAVAYGDNIVRAGDALESMQARVRIFSDGAGHAAQNVDAIYTAAARARTSVQALSTLWTRLAPAMNDRGRTPADALNVTRLVSQAQTIGGTDVRESLASTVQFSQAIGSGVLRGDELRSLMESAPQLMRYIAQGLEIDGKVGVAFSQLRSLGEQGALTADRIIDALLRVQDKIETDFANAPVTAAQAWQVASDTIQRSIGEIALDSGLQDQVIEWLSSVSAAAERLRTDLSLNQAATEGLRGFLDFIETVGAGLAGLGQIAVENFDTLVDAAEAVIAIQLGSWFAQWTGAALRGVQLVTGQVMEFARAVRWAAGADAAKPEAALALRLRAAADTEAAKAAALTAKADESAAAAATMRARADAATLQANIAKRDATVSSTVATAAETEAERLNAAATKLEEKASRDAAAANRQQAASSAASTAATAAETNVIRQATIAQMAKNAAVRVGTGLLNLMGGPIGAVTLALGAMVYALWQAKQAHDAHVAGMIAARDAHQQFINWQNQMRGAIELTTDALRRQFNERVAVAESQQRADQAQLDRLIAQRDRQREIEAAFPMSAASGTMARLDREIADLQRAMVAGQASLAYLRRSGRLDIGRQAAVESRETVNSLSGLSGQELAEARRQLAEERAAAERDLRIAEQGLESTQANVDRLRTAMLGAEGTANYDAARLSYQRAMESLDRWQEQFDVANERVAATESRATPTAPTATETATGGSTAGGGRDNSAAEAERAAREAEQAAEQAARAEERWSDLQAEINGDSLVAIRAQREINDLREQGADITDLAAQAYLARADAIERAREAAEALQEVQSDVSDAFNHALAMQPEAIDARGVVDVRAAAETLARIREQVLEDSEERILRNLRRQAESRAWTEEEIQRQLGLRMAAQRVAIEQETLDRLSEARRQAAEEDFAYAEERISEMSKRLEGAVNDLFFARDMDEVADIGARLVNDLLQAVYEELIGSPLRFAIQTALRELFSGGGKGGGGWQQFAFDVLGRAFGFSGGGGGAGLPGAGSGPKGFGGYGPGKAPLGSPIGAPLGSFDGAAMVKASIAADAASISRSMLDAPVFSAPVPVAIAAPAAKAPSIQIINNSRVQVTERRETGSDGLTRLYLEDMPDRVVKKAASTGALGRAARAGPQPRNRP